MVWQTKRKPNDLQEAAEKILSAALNYVAKREYSVHELRQKLLNRGASEVKVEEVIAQLIKLGYLDDARFALAYVRNRREFRPCGVAVIRQELHKQYIDDELIDMAIEEEYDECQQRKVLNALIQKEMNKVVANFEPEYLEKEREKMIRKLLAKGFCLSMILNEMEDMDKMTV